MHLPPLTGSPRRRPLWPAAATAIAITLLPLAAPAPAAAQSTAMRCAPVTGPYQWEVEKKLKLRQDGRASQADCEAVRRLQKRLGLKQTGKADMRTYRMLLVDEARRNPNARKQCPRRAFRVTCIDLNRQILWVQKARTGKLAFGPVPMRSGLRGAETRTGWHAVYWRHKKHFSTIYNNAPMPYAQFFDGGQALHGTYHDLFSSGSGGCINLRVKDAAKLWKLLHTGDRVYVWGKKSGTNRRALTATERDNLLIAEGFGSLSITPEVDLDTPLTPPTSQPRS
ncbi:L,D-transpeptidase family protein [Streptomyces fractus]|uniref:L,D-transpeptidase family protein n=1 Tax=Streptomyces fractus TaxID=641806 RepID=UPI003CE7A6E4